MRKEDICFRVLNFPIHHIHGLLTINLKEENQFDSCLLTRVYEHPDLNHRTKVWNLICKIGEMIDKPWVVFDDFNDILHLAKKKWGGRAHPKKQMGDLEWF